jgi:RNA polymerase sigma-70 factor (ECF subfamily)
MSNRRDYTSLGGTDGQFPQTAWTMILDPTRREAILAELCTKYWKPLYRYLRCKGFSNEEAKDLVQGFFTEKVIGREFLKRVDRTKGRFRNFLLVAMRNYAINIQKKDKVPLELDDVASGLSGTDDPETEFNRVWAYELLQQMLKELENECQRRGKIAHWQIFREWLLEPAIDDDRTQMSRICTKYGVASASQAYNMISKTKMRFRAILRRNLRCFVDSDAEVGGEISKFIKVFSSNPRRI